MFSQDLSKAYEGNGLTTVYILFISLMRIYMYYIDLIDEGYLVVESCALITQVRTISHKSCYALTWHKIMNWSNIPKSKTTNILSCLCYTYAVSNMLNNSPFFMKPKYTLQKNYSALIWTSISSWPIGLNQSVWSVASTLMWALSWNPFHCWSVQVLCIITAQGSGQLYI